jgi:transglutaminase-like putative cysteine protease
MTNPVKSLFLYLLMAATMLLASRPAEASCFLKIVKVTPCLSTGAPGTPQFGTPYGVRVTFDVAGTPKPFGIKFTMANVSHTFTGYDPKAANGYYSYCLWSLPLDDTIPYSVTLDPANVSGNTNPNTTVTGTFSPAPPATIVQTYSPVTRHGAVSRTITFSSGGNLTNLYVLLGVPTTHGAQTVLATTAPAGSTTVVTQPYSLPVYQILDSNVPTGTFTFSNSFTVTLSNMRVNPALLRKITWASLHSLTSEYTQWLTPDTINESTDPSITSFVANALPSDYLTAMTPYDAARTIHKAVMKALTYVEPPPYRDAVASLQAQSGDCGCYAAIMVASLRSIGIPARRISGFWQGFSQSHIRVEFYLPGAGWLVADPTLGNGADPTGTYAYYFGSASDSNEFVAVDDCDSHEMSFENVNSQVVDIGAQDLQVPNFWYYTNTGTTILSDTQFSYLETGSNAEYTLLLLPASSSAGIPKGNGYGLLTLSSTGGALGGAGGDQFIFNTPLAYPASAQGALSGTLSFVTTTGPFQTTGTGDLDGAIGWAKPAESGGNFPGAFQTSLNVAGSLYNPPAAGVSVLPGFTRGTLVLTGTGGTSLVKDVTLTAANALTVANPAADKLKVTITPATGVFKGTFLDARPGGAAVLTTFTGVLFQQESNGGGFFVGTKDSGSVTLQP